MALVTKRVYPTEIPVRFFTYYDINLDTFTADTGTVDGVWGYWYKVTARGSVYLDNRIFGYMRFDISTIKSAINAKFVYSITGTNSRYNSTLLSGANMYYRVSSVGPNTNTTFNINSSGDITITDLAGLNFYNTVQFTFEGFANSMSRKNTSTGAWQDAAVASISTFSNHWAVEIIKNVDQTAQAHYIEYQAYEPVITNFTTTGTSIDNSITATWKNEDVETWKLEALQNNVLVATLTGTTQETATFPSNTLKKNGSTIFRLTATGSGASITQETTVNLTWTEASISSLEPSGVNQNINLPITISWATLNQSSFKLTIGGNIYTGTTAKSLVLQSNTLTSGTKTMTLEITYQGVGYTTTDTKTVTFLAYGKPPIPIQDSVTSYRGALPTFTWTSSEQTAYQVKVFLEQTQIVDSGEIISTALSYAVTTALTNLTTYRALVRVKNQYGLWSDYSEKTFEISYTEMPQPTISSYGDATNCAIVTNFEILDAVGFAKNELWRKEQYGEWIRIAYNMSQKDVYVDYYVKANTEYTYKCRAVDIYGGISESELITATAQVYNFRFYDLEDFDNFIELKMDPVVTPTRVKNKAVELYAGCSAPSIETDGVIYNTYAMEFAVSKAELDKFTDITDKAKVILYRDSRGNKSFGQVISNITPVKDRGIDLYSIKFTFCDVAFLERDVYNGAQHAILLYFDGTWLFDGAQYFTGFRSW